MIDFQTGHGLLTNDYTMVVIPVNAVGTMGKGLALEFRKEYPERVPFYEMICKEGFLKAGGCIADLQGEPWVAHFATKDHWKHPSQLAWIQSGALALRKIIEDYKPASVGIPALGCGEGGLSWTDVRRILEASLKGLPSEITLFLP